MKLSILLLFIIPSTVIAETADYETVKRQCDIVKEPIKIEYCSTFIKIHENREDCSKSDAECDLDELKSLMTLKEYISLKINLIKSNELDPNQIQEICKTKKDANYDTCITELLIEKNEQNCTKSGSECSHDKAIALSTLSKYMDIEIAWWKNNLKKLDNE